MEEKSEKIGEERGERERERCGMVWEGGVSNERIRVVSQFIYSRWVGARPA